MSKIINFGRKLKNNWKKTTVACIAIVYGYDFAKIEYRKNLLLRHYCTLAAKFGDAPLPILESPRHVIVILNPAANKRKSKKEYETYCAPLLHLSGIAVSLFTTNEEYDAINLTKKVDNSVDAIIVAGGDGTISEVVTGLLRQKNEGTLIKNIPLGIIPVGKTNSLASRLFSPNDEESNEKLKRLKLMLDATYSIINETTNSLSVMRIENLNKEENPNSKPVYAISGISWGLFKNVKSNEDKFWYFGKFRSLASYVFGHYNYNAPIKATVEYSFPCTGCSSCYKNRPDFPKYENKNKSWWHIFIPRFSSTRSNKELEINYETVSNESCGKLNEIAVKSIDINIIPEILNKVPSLRIEIGPEQIDYFNFVKEGWSRMNSISYLKNEYNKYNAQTIYITPDHNESTDLWLSIDNEDYEVKKMNITLLHNILSVFCPSA